MNHELEQLEEHRLFGGWQRRYRHPASSLNCSMTFSLFLPAAYGERPLPVLYWLSGLTCTDENFSLKAGAQRIASELGLVLVIPDTSPRGEDVADNASYDLGQGAGFYVNATQAPWSAHYRMYDYIVTELPELIEQQFQVSQRRAIAGHSMGGHGALMIALRNPQRYCSASAFAPIVNPTRTPWGRQALGAYLGSDEATWLEYDSCHLLRHSQTPFPILIDQGDRDPYLDEQLRPDRLEEVAQALNYPLRLRMQSGYDHGYFFVSTFIEQHLRFHAEHLAR